MKYLVALAALLCAAGGGAVLSAWILFGAMHEHAKADRQVTKTLKQLRAICAPPRIQPAKRERV